MKHLTLAVVLIALGIVSLDAQIKTVHFKKLQECLPSKDFKGFKREKPTGSTQTSMGMSTSEASVRYVSIPKDSMAEVQTEPTISLEAKINDMVMMPYALMPFSMQQDFENETEDGYEKSVKVLGKYIGREEARKGDSKSCHTTFGIANRFLVEVQASGTDDVKLLEQLLNGMDLAKLEKLATPQ